MTEPRRSSLRKLIDHELDELQWPVPFDIGGLLERCQGCSATGLVTWPNRRNALPRSQSNQVS